MRYLILLQYEWKVLLNLCAPNNRVDGKKFPQPNMQLRRDNRFRILVLSREGARLQVVGMR